VPLFKNPVTGTQSYGGSRGVRDHIEMWRKSAAAREMLKQAAANEWGVPVDQVDTEPDVVVHKPTGRRLSYAQLVDKAQALPVPQNPKLKTPDQFRYIGKTVKRRDTPEKVTGKGIYGMGVQVPGMLVASIERCPVIGGKVKSFDATATRAVKGVRDVVQVSNGVAVVAESFCRPRSSTPSTRKPRSSRARLPATTATPKARWPAAGRSTRPSTRCRTSSTRAWSR
jgi:isoquinoline 1-oxidoreductase beta subunit